MKLRRLISWLIAIAVTAACPAGLAEELVLPESVKIIGEEAFSGDPSIGSVTVPEGALEIRSRAFADSSVGQLALPESLEFIADDILDGCGDVTVETVKGCYAYDWCVEHGFTGPELTLQAEPSVRACLTGGKISWTLTADGGKAPYECSVSVCVDGSEIVSHTGDFYRLTLTAANPGVYSLRATVRDFWGTVAEVCADEVRVFSPPAIDLTAKQTGPDSLSVVWQSDASALYSLEMALSPDGEYAAVDGVSGTGAELSGLTCGETYYFRVRADVTETLADGSTFTYETLSEPVACSVLENNYEFMLLGGECRITRVSLWDESDASVLAFPAEISGCPVTQIGKNVVGNRSLITAIVLPDSVRKIDSTAFYGCTALESVVMEDSVTEIGDYAFAGCTALESVVLSDSVARIGERAFLNDASLERIELPAALERLGRRAFYGTGVTSFALPDGLSEIGAQALGEAVSEITTGAQASGFRAVDNILYTADLSKLVCIPAQAVGSAYTAPAGLKAVGDYAFAGRTALQTVTLSESTAAIGAHAFEGCSALTTVDGAQNLVSIADEAFYGCTALTDSLFDGMTALKSIGSYAFTECAALQTADLPESFTSLGEYAFGNCTALTGVRLPSAMAFIGDAAFYGCTALTAAALPESVDDVEEFGTHLFYNCTSLTEISIPSGVDKLGKYCFRGCSKLKSAALPEDLLEIGYGAFFGCRTLSQINIPKTVTSIDAYAFSNCAKLPALELPACTLGVYAFGACRAITSVTFTGEDAFSIAGNAFYYCDRMTKAVLPSSVTFIDATAFSNCPLVVLYVEEGSVGHEFALKNSLSYQLQ